MSFQLDAFQSVAFQGPYAQPVTAGVITGLYSQFTLEIAEMFEEAFERAQLSPQAIGPEHINSAMRSVKLLLSEWQTIGLRDLAMKSATETLVTGVNTWTMPVGAVDIFDAVLRRDGNDTPMYRMARKEYLEIATKDSRGRPDRYFVDRKYNQNIVYLWPTPENSTDQIVYEYMRSLSDPGRTANILELPPYIMEAFTAGLAMKISQKYSRDVYNDLRIDYGGERYPEAMGGKIQLARCENGERADVMFSFGYSRRYGR
jgi:hypothetical protein